MITFLDISRNNGTQRDSCVKRNSIKKLSIRLTIMNLRFGQKFNILIWKLFAWHKADYYRIRKEQGMAKIFAYRNAKKISLKDYNDFLRNLNENK